MRGWHGRGYLPHFDGIDTIQFITLRLHDSVPRQVIEQWKLELKSIPEEKTKRAVLLALRIERFLDQGIGECHLGRPRIAALVGKAIRHFDGERYRLHEWVVMPNHVHLLFTQFPDWPLGKVIHSLKSFTALQANRILGRTGDFWFADYFDRYIRDGDHFSKCAAYIRENPVKAKLCRTPEDWPFGSAWERAHPARNV